MGDIRMLAQSQYTTVPDSNTSVGRFGLLRFLCVAFLPAGLALTSTEASLGMLDKFGESSHDKEG
jgi:hypothetical protein